MSAEPCRLYKKKDLKHSRKGSPIRLPMRNRHRSALPILFLAAFSISGMAQQNPSGKEWRQTPKSDATHDTPYTEFALAGKWVKWPQAEVSVRPSLILNCAPEVRFHGRGDLLQSYVLVGTALKIAYIEPEEIHGTSYYPMVSVKYQLDGGKTKMENWAPGPEKNSVSIPENVVKELLRAHSLLIHANEKDAGEVSMQFDIPDPAQVEAGCGVDLHKK